MKKGLGLMEKSEGLPSDGVWGYPPQGDALMKKRGLGNPPARDKISLPFSLHFIKKNISQKCFLKKLMIFFGNVKEKQ